MSFEAVANLLEQTVMPVIAGATFADTMTIKRRTVTNVNGSEKVDVSDAYELVRVDIKESRQSGRNKEMLSDKPTSRGLYLLEFPKWYDGARLDFDIATDYFVTNERGVEPEKTFRPVSYTEEPGGGYKVVCTKED